MKKIIDHMLRFPVIKMDVMLIKIAFLKIRKKAGL